MGKSCQLTTRRCALSRTTKTLGKNNELGEFFEVWAVASLFYRIRSRRDFANDVLLVSCTRWGSEIRDDVARFLEWVRLA